MLCWHIVPVVRGKAKTGWLLGRKQMESQGLQTVKGSRDGAELALLCRDIPLLADMVIKL